MKGNSGHSGISEALKRTLSKIVTAPAIIVPIILILLIVSGIIDSSMLDRNNQYFMVVLLQLLVFALPLSSYCMLKKGVDLNRLRIKPMPWNNIWVVISGSVVMISGGVLISIVLSSYQTDFSLYNTFAYTNGGGFPESLYMAIAYALIPAVCEELVFRGLLCAEYENDGRLISVCMSTVYFAMIHFDPIRLPMYIYAGVLLCAVMYLTRSLVASMLVHFIYNLYCVFGQRYVNLFYQTTGAANLFVFAVGILFFVAAIAFCGSAAKTYKKYAKDPSEGKYYTAPAMTDEMKILREKLRSTSNILKRIPLYCSIYIKPVLLKMANPVFAISLVLYISAIIFI